MDYLFKVMGQLQAALAHLADEDDVKQTLSQLPQIVVLGGQVRAVEPSSSPGEALALALTGLRLGYARMHAADTSYSCL